MIALGIGELVLDKTLLCEGFPKEGAKLTPRKTENSIGGPVPTALILLAKLGVEVYLLASVGDDEAGEVLKNKLEKFGVKLIPFRTKHTKTHTVLVNSGSGSRTIIKDCVQGELIKAIPLPLLKKADVVIFDRHEPKAFDYVITHKEAQTKVIIDPSDEVSEKTLNMLKNTEIPIVPIEFLTKLRRHEGLQENIDALYEVIGKSFIITAGGLGSVLYNGKDLICYPSYKVDVVDTLGAGDIYRGAFAYGVLQNWQLEKQVDFANLVAGLQCTKLGNSTAIPDREYIMNSHDSLEKHNLTINLLMENYAS